MKIKSKSSKYFALCFVVVIIAALAGFTYFQSNHAAKQDTEQSLPGEQAADQAGNYVEPEDEDVDLEQSDQPTRSTGSDDPKSLIPQKDSNQSTPEKPVITRANQSRGAVKVVAMLQTASDGKCKLTMSKNGYDDITREVSIVVAPSYYVCDGFSVSLDDIPVAGEWKVIIEHLNAGNATSSDPVNIRIDKS